MIARPGVKTIPIRIPDDMLVKVRVIVAVKDMTMLDYLMDALTTVVNKDYPEVVQKMASDLEVKQAG